MISQTHNRRNDTEFIPVHMASWQLALKRTFDFVCALLGIIVFSPLFIVIYVALLTQRDGSPIFSQERIGMKGRPFNIYKFRTMHVGAENGTPILAQKEDARLTPFGRFLRKHHLDELPQLWNVLKGDMSFVGYRPERQYFINQIMKHDVRYEFLYQMRPGITSDATIYNGYTDTMEKMLERLSMDLHYLKTASLTGDVIIILKTLGIVAKGNE
ncbi:MAG: sugar transferase [Bacteroidaceae bacterium]|jgi:lipopolysaccharide/colanic/teichoic acid biosynthesis glycosyltransferase|nr:sugar transferase [Bacteroidaceae bacterium]